MNANNHNGDEKMTNLNSDHWENETMRELIARLAREFEEIKAMTETLKRPETK